MTFKDFITQYKDTESPMGTFAYDVSRDNSFPENEQTYSRLLQYFEHQEWLQQNPDVTRLFEVAWAFYRELT